MASKTISNTAQQVVPSRARSALILQNRGSAEIFLGPAGVTAGGGPDAGIGIAPGATMSLTDLPGDSGRAIHAPIYAVTATGSAELRYWEVIV